MNDDTLDPRHELASAYLDGEATADERARVEASSELQDLADGFRQVRAALADVEPAGVDVQERAMAAALAEFDRLHGPAAATPAPAGTVVRIGGWRTWQWRIVTGAAAAAVVALVGMVVLSGGPSDNDASTSEKSDDAARTLDAPITPMSAAPEAAGADLPRPTIGGIFGPADAVLVISTPAELLAYASTERDVPPGVADTTSDSTPEVARLDLPCVTDGTVALGEVVYVDTPAVVVRDTATGAVRALDTTSCAVLVEVEP